VLDNMEKKYRIKVVFLNKTLSSSLFLLI